MFLRNSCKFCSKFSSRMAQWYVACTQSWNTKYTKAFNIQVSKIGENMLKRAAIILSAAY